MKTIMILTVTGLLLLTGCFREYPCTRGEGSIEQVTLDLADFNSINLQGSMDVEVVYGAVQEVVAEGQQNIIDELETSVVDGTWYISLGTGCFTDFDLKIYITLPLLAKTKISGSGDIVVKDATVTESFSAESAGSGKTVIGSLNGASVINVKISGSGSISFLNACPGVGKLLVTNTASASFHGYPLVVPECTVNVSGSGSCEVSASEKLNVRIIGSGNVYYKGRPVVDVDDSGSGKLISRN
jgi:hypothetical protein